MSARIRYLDALLAALGLAGKVRRGGALEIGDSTTMPPVRDGPGVSFFRVKVNKCVLERRVMWTP